MRPPTTCIPWLPWLLCLSSCGTPPKPPTVDESTKRPANSAQAVELQVCRTELQNTRIEARTQSRLAEFTAASLQSLAAQRQAAVAAPAPTSHAPLASSTSTAVPNAAAHANPVYTVHFDFGSSRLHIPDSTTQALLAEARTAPLVLLRARTDGLSDSAADSRIARERAAAVRAHLIAAGIAPDHIRATFQPSGDHMADNSLASGRDLNRRVEIEVYRHAPINVPPGIGAPGLVPPVHNALVSVGPALP